MDLSIFKQFVKGPYFGHSTRACTSLNVALLTAFDKDLVTTLHGIVAKVQRLESNLRSIERICTYYEC